MNTTDSYTVYLNALKLAWGPKLIQLISRLCNAKSPAEWGPILLEIQHLYLIRRQMHWERRSRLELSPDDPTIPSVIAQTTAGRADPQACRTIKRPWEFAGGGHAGQRKSMKTRGEEAFPHLAKVKRIVAQIETRYSIELPRIEGAIYLFNWQNRPALWSWEANRRFYGRMLATMAERCNRHFDLTCSVSIFWNTFKLSLTSPG